MRTLLIGGALGVLVVSLAACGGSSTSSASEQALQRQGGSLGDRPDREELPQGDVEEGHRPDDEPVGPARDLHLRSRGYATGTKQIRQAFLDESEAFKPTNHWVSDTPAYKVRITVNGDRGTLNFECHYVDIKTGKVVSHTAADQEVARMNGQWLITSMVGAISPADPLSPCRKLRNEGTRIAVVEKRQAMSRGDNPLVRAVGRLPAKVHTKLLIAFVGTTVLVVAVGVLGLRVLGQSNDRVGTLGALQERASAYGKLQSDDVGCSSAPRGERRLGLLQGQPRRVPTGRGQPSRCRPGDR